MDYAICHRDEEQLPHLVVVEAKKAGTEAVSQCIGPCASIYYQRKQARMDNLCVYGILSDGALWKFIFIDQDGTAFVSGDYALSISNYAENYIAEQLLLIYRLVHYVVKQSFYNSPRSTPGTTPNVSTTNLTQ